MHPKFNEETTKINLEIPLYLKERIDELAKDLNVSFDLYAIYMLLCSTSCNPEQENSPHEIIRRMHLVCRGEI